MAEEDPASRAKAMKAVQDIFDRYHRICTAHSFTGYDKHLMSNATLINATASGTVDIDFLITPAYSNINGVMHGGAAGVIFDMFTTIALGPLSKPGYWDFLGGVTRSLSVSYLRAVPVGTTVRIHSEVMQVGRTMALIRGTMGSQDGQTVYCTCEHHKVHVPTQEAHSKL